LYKQILSEADKSFVIDEIKDEEHLLEVIRKTKSVNTEKIPHIKELIEKFIKNKQDFDRGKIYLSKQAINTLSSKCFESWDYIRNFFPDKTLKDFMSF
jgi:CRISPR-associated protein Cpf1